MSPCHTVDGQEERMPLLDHTIEPAESSESKLPMRFSLQQRNVYILAFLVLILIEMGTYLQNAPMIRVLEDAICRNYYPELAVVGREVNDARCKGREVQGELATLRGWNITFECIPGILTAIPYGFLADKYGRKPIFCLSVFGILLNMVFYVLVCWFSDVLPLRLTWLSYAFTFIGGGAAVFNAVGLTIIADVTSEGNRSTTFFYLAASGIIGEIAASMLASLLMARSPWIPIFLGLGFSALTLCVALLMPDTLHVRTHGTVPVDLQTEDDDVSGQDDAHESWYKKTWTNLSRFRTAAFDFIWAKKHIALLLSTTIFMTLTSCVFGFLLPYATLRYHWTWAQAGYLLSLRAIASLVLLTIILPGANYLLMSKFPGQTLRKDLWLARGSSIATAAGLLAVAVSSAPVGVILGVTIWSLGGGYKLIIRSLLASVVEAHHVGTLYNTIGVLEAMAAVVGGPLLATIFLGGMDLGSEWIGLPFFIASVLATFAVGFVCVVRLPRLDT